jgi:hypothetical protein
MANSEGYLRGLSGAGGDWGSAVREFRGWFGKHAADRLAAVGGVSRRTAERWLAKAEGKTSQASTPKAAKQAGIVEAARNQRAARKLRAAQTVSVGRIAVEYVDDMRPEGLRNVGTLPVAGTLAQAVSTAADLVASGDYGRAAEVLDAGVLDAYGVPEGTLGITNYPDGFSIE